MSKHSITAPLTMTIYQMQNKRQGRTWIHLPQRSTTDEKWEAELPLSWRKIKNNICSFREKIRTKQWRFGVSSPHGSEWEVGGTSTWPKGRLPDSILIHPHPSASSAVRLTLQPLNYLSVCLSLFLQLLPIRPSVHMPCQSSSRRWEERSEEELKGGRGCSGGLAKRQPGNSPQRLSLKPPLPHLTLCPGSPDKPTTHTYTYVSAHRNTHRQAWSHRLLPYCTAPTGTEGGVIHPCWFGDCVPRT